MSTLTQGSQLFCIDPDTQQVLRIGGITAFNPGSSPADQIEDTPLEERNARSYKKGLRTPSAASASINADPTVPAHVRLYEFANEDADRNVQWALGWSDGDAIPAVTTGVATIQVTDGGSGYSNPTVSLSGGEGSGAQATAVVNGGVITAITITESGQGYTAAPTVTISGEGSGAAATAVLGSPQFLLPSTRTWFTFEGYVSDFPFDFQANSVVQSEVSIQRSGAGQWQRKQEA